MLRNGHSERAACREEESPAIHGISRFARNDNIKKSSVTILRSAFKYKNTLSEKEFYPIISFLILM